ncbi:MAG: hypothetical protein LBT01_07380 [Spirochaetaceae bacterium]|jgi:hypothetical protein|nr:hypothetical protein [Spirochaetaceae bacterium]
MVKKSILILVLATFVAGGVFAEDSFFFLYGTTSTENSTGNGNGTQDSNNVKAAPPAPKLIGYNVVVYGPVASNGTSTRYGTETYTIYKTNQQTARDEARQQFMSAHHVRQNVTVRSVTPMYQ